MAVSFSNGVKKWQTNRVTGQLFLLFFFPFSFFLWIKLGLFLLFLPAFVFFPLITHICFSLFESGFPRWLPPVVDDDSTKGVRTTIPVGFSIAKAEGAPWPAPHTPVLSGDLDATGSGPGRACHARLGGEIKGNSQSVRNVASLGHGDERAPHVVDADLDACRICDAVEREGRLLDMPAGAVDWKDVRAHHDRSRDAP